jgi:hypothetical protein
MVARQIELDMAHFNISIDKNIGQFIVKQKQPGQTAKLRSTPCQATTSCRMSADDIGIYVRISAVLCIVAALWSLWLILAREWVKNDIRARGFRPIHVRWQPFAWWPCWGPAFRVLYLDGAGSVHQARCGVCAWHRPVRWRDDKLVAVA